MNAADRPGPVRYVDHVGIVVADADVAAAGFRGALGMSVVHDEVVPDVGVRLVYLAGADRVSPTTIQLVQPVRPGPIRDYLEQRGEGPHHVCLAVTDIGAALDRLPGEQNSVPFTGGRGRRACFLVARPGSTLLELVEVGVALASESGTA